MKKILVPASGDAKKCPICGKLRGSGSPDEYKHGPCMEELAKAPPENEKHKLTRAQGVAKRYRDGKLPDWMYL
jgi:hypothetical protein